jgi:hypothetical protein
VIWHIRERLSCRVCEVVVAAPAPDHAIGRGRARAGLLAHIVVSKYDDHLPLYHQPEIFARRGDPGDLARCGWVGATAAELQPLVDALSMITTLAGDRLGKRDRQRSKRQEVPAPRPRAQTVTRRDRPRRCRAAGERAYFRRERWASCLGCGGANVKPVLSSKATSTPMPHSAWRFSALQIAARHRPDREVAS